MHNYRVTVRWTGNHGTGTSSYREYGRDNEVSADGPPTLAGSSDPAFRGDADRWNPEQLLVASLSQCHMLWYLHVCTKNGMVVTDYVDTAEGTLVLDDDGGGRFTEAVLRPNVTVATAEMISGAHAAHHQAHELCFIANSVNFPVTLAPQVTSAK
jgi:organic hydroperoxide reductase OsmC/OhrA